MERNEFEIDKKGNLKILKIYLDGAQNRRVEKFDIQLSKEDCKQLIKELEEYVKESE